MQRFELGDIGISESAQRALAAAGVNVSGFLERHQQGDWGEEADAFDRATSDWGLQHGHSVMSIYPLADGMPLFIFTDDSRTLTRVLVEGDLESREVSAQEGYEIWAGFYDDEQNPLITLEEPRVEQLIAESEVEITASTRVLDFAAGTGRYALRLARMGAKVTAVDQSPAMLAVARAAAEREGLHIDFSEGTVGTLGEAEEAGSLPFADWSFDLVVCALALSHMPDLHSAICELARVVAKGGHLLITDMHPLLFGEGIRTVIFRMGVRYVFPNTYHPPARIVEEVEAADLMVIQVVDVPVDELPPNPLWDDLRIGLAGRPFGFILLARRS